MTWQAEPVSTVRSPPIRSAMKPQSWRPIKPKANSTDNIALPRVTGIPWAMLEQTISMEMQGWRTTRR
jgi:hypothetical protein